MSDPIEFDAYPAEIPQVVTDWLIEDIDARRIELVYSGNGYGNTYGDDERTIVKIGAEWTVTLIQFNFEGGEFRMSGIDENVFTAALESLEKMKEHCPW